MATNFPSYSDSEFSPSRAPYAITLHDSDDLPAIPKGIYVGTGGDVTLRGVEGEADVTYRDLPDASYIAVRATHVRATGATAADPIGEALAMTRMSGSIGFSNSAGRKMGGILRRFRGINH